MSARSRRTSRSPCSPTRAIATPSGERCVRGSSRTGTSWRRWTARRPSTSSASGAWRSGRWDAGSMTIPLSSWPPARPGCSAAGWPPSTAAGVSRPVERSSHVGDQLLDAFVHGFEWVLAEDGPLRLVVQLQVHPVHRVVTALRLRLTDEVAAELRARRLGRFPHRFRDLLFRDDPVDPPAVLEEVVEPPTPIHVVGGEVEERDPRRREREVVLPHVAFDHQPLRHPIHL